MLTIWCLQTIQVRHKLVLRVSVLDLAFSRSMRRRGSDDMNQSRYGTCSGSIGRNDHWIILFGMDVQMRAADFHERRQRLLQDWVK